MEPNIINIINSSGKQLLLSLSFLFILFNLTHAQYNTKLGYNAGGIDTTGHRNVMVGSHAGELNNGSGNIFIGNQAGQKLDTVNNILLITNDTFRNTIYGDLKKQRVAIGSRKFPTDTTYRLAVEGKIIAREYKATQTMPWPDYVFSDDYQLISLDSLAQFIELHNHLPDISSASEVSENGIMLAEMNSILLRKIEELTLYIIQQQEKITDLNNRMVLLSQAIDFNSKKQ